MNLPPMYSSNDTAAMQKATSILVHVGRSWIIGPMYLPWEDTNSTGCN